LYQTVRNVKNGNYELRVQALYRTGKNDGGKAYKEGTETIPANISIATTTQPIASLYSVPYSGDTSSFDTVEILNGYANSMATASVCFGQGAYWNTIAAPVSNNRIRVGLVNKGSLDDSWCCFDNFQLYYCGGDPALSIQDTGAPQSDKVDVYSIDGVLCKEQVPFKDALKGLHKGIYIIGGKKVEVK
jgi:hypothetical protein